MGFGEQLIARTRSLPAVGPVRQEDENDQEDWLPTDLPESSVICYLLFVIWTSLRRVPGRSSKMFLHTHLVGFA
jgi:hypothetical protein